MISRLIGLVARMQQRPLLLLTALVAVTVLAMASAGQLQINSTPYMIDRSHPSRVADHDTKSLFSNTGEQAFVAIENTDGSIFNPDSLQLVTNLTRAFEQMVLVAPSDIEQLEALAGQGGVAEAGAILENGLEPGDALRLPALRRTLEDVGELTDSRAAWLDSLAVRLDPVRRVRSLLTMETIEPTGDGLEVDKVMPQVPSTPEAMAKQERQVLGNPLFINGLISPDGSATTIQIEFNIAEDDSPAMLMAYNAITEITEAVVSDDRIYLSGPPMIASQTAANMEKDNQTLLPGVLLVILLILFASFGRIQGVVAPLVIAVLSLIWTMGLMSAFGVKQNIVTSMLPVFIVAIAVCDAIHFLSDYYRHLPADPDRKARTAAVVSSLRQLFWPMLVTTATTMVGFFSLAWTEVTFIREFGIFVGLGVFLAWLLTMLFLPALVILWKTRPPRFGLLTSSALDRASQQLGRFARYGRHVVYGVLVLIAGGGWYVTQALNVDNQVIGYFEDDSRIRIDDAAINAKFGGTTTISVLLESNRVDVFKTPEMMSAVDRIEKRLRDNALVGYTYSAADFVERMNWALSDSPKPADHRLPDNLTGPMLAQYFLLYENANGQDLFDVVDRRFQNGRILAVLHTDRSSEVSAIMDDVVKYAAGLFPPDTRVRVSGYGEILVSTTDAVVWGQVQSLLLAAVIIALLVMVICRSWRLGLLALVPLVFTLVGVFSLMAVTGTDLDIGTAIIAAISFGIGIDYAIHIIAALRSGYGRDDTEVIQHALKRCAKPILINTLALGLGFLVLTLSGYQALVNLGYFISLTMLFCALFALLILPALVPTAKSDEAIAEAERANV